MSDTKDTYSYSLSPMQAGMFFQSLYGAKTGVDVEQIISSFANIDPAILHQAWGHVWQTNETLRTGFAWQGLDEPIQKTHDNINLPWKYINWTSQEENAPSLLADFLRQDRLEGFSLDQPPLMRLTLIEIKSGVFRLVWSFHHILLDGRAFPVIFRKMAEAYDAISQGQPAPQDTSRPYRDYIEWLKQQDWAPAKEYWKKQLQGLQNTTPLGIGHPQPPVPADELDFGLLTTYVSEEIVSKLKILAKENSFTLNTVVQGAWAILLNRYSGETDIVFGSIRTGRHTALGRQGTDEMVGLMINTLPVRVKIDPQGPALQVVKDLRKSALELRNSPLYEHVALAEIQKLGEIKPGTRLFDSMLAYENFESTELFKSQHPMLATWSFEIIAHVGYPLIITATDDKKFKTSLEYSLALFTEESARRILGHMQAVLKSIADDPHGPVGRINILPDAEKQQILVDWNKTQCEYPQDACIHMLFEAQAKKTPQAPAVAYENQTISYQDLNQHANQLAHFLQKQGVGPDILVGLCAERSLEMIIGLLGILKAGGAYVPLNPTFPSDRLAFLVKDTRTSIILTQKHLSAFLPQGAAQIVCLDTDRELFDAETTSEPESTVQPSNLVYAVYTSGSTGQAKGVMVNHANLVNAYIGWEKAYELKEKSGVHLQMANFSFDVFAGDWTRALCSGGKLVICPHMALLDPPMLYKIMQHEKVTCAEFVPAVFRNLQAYLEEQGKTLDFMRILVVASDSWYVSEALEILKLCGPKTRLINSYGITETTIDSTYFDCQELYQNGKIRNDLLTNSLVPIGKPFANVRTYILDSLLQPVPIGVAGELYIGGAGVTRGYLNKPELTQERFIRDIFDPENNGRLYKTGDLARYLANGNIEFLGRQDQQVKIRGVRIELGEIESALEQHPSIREVVVIARPDHIGQKRLVAYFTSNGQDTNLSATLRDYLKQKLPDYMIPSDFMRLEKFFTNSSGKINRQNLPEPDFQASVSSGLPASPRTPTEHTLVQIWVNVLGIKEVGIYDNFFELGGHSLTATRLFARIRATLGLELPLRILFETPVLADLAKRIENLLWAIQQAQMPAQVGDAGGEDITI